MESSEGQSAFRSLWMFAAKLAITLFIFGLFVEMFVPDFSEIRTSLATQKGAIQQRLNRTFGNERTKLYILSFVQNPMALYKTSEIAERENKFDSAVRDMELAIGLLEMHNADKQVIRRYSDRLEKLKLALLKRP